MCVHTISLLLAISFAAVLWRGVHSFSPVPSTPDRVPAVVGSCVVIPCSFTLHPLQGKRDKVDVRLRSTYGRHNFPLRRTAFNSEDRDQASRDFKSRTSLFGQTSEGDCSVKIERIRLDDSRDFEISLKRSDNWGKARSFTLDVLENPETPVISGIMEATEGQLVTMNCSVSFYCPSSPPVLQWVWERDTQMNSSESGEVQIVLHPEPHRLLLLATVSFTVSHKVKPRLRCEARHPGAKALTASKDLHVTFSPKDVVVEVHTLMVLEGGNAFLICSCKADPPVTEYRWSYRQHGHTVHLHQHSHTIRVFNVTRDMRVRCSARNRIGRGESEPTLLNVQYKPAILHLSSTCTVEDQEVLCRCSVDSNPKAAITWSVNGSAPPHNYNVSVSSEPDKLTATLRGHMDKPQAVICSAVNDLGNDSLVLLQGGEETSPWLWMVILAVAICLAIFLLTLFFYCLRKKAGKRPAMCPGGLGIFEAQMPIYINCTEVTHVYTNGSYQLVYENSTPLFVHTKQIRPMGRRGGERRRWGEGAGMERREGPGARDTREVQSGAVGDADTAIYLEIL